jgi:Holliday junction DNA helicase RuvA
VISSVSGQVAAVGIDSAVVEVGGVGFAVMCTPSTLASLRVGQRSSLATSLVVREDSLTLFGFLDDDERCLFELLQTASGVGPKMAQAMLAVHGPDQLRAAIASEDLVALCKVSGIGKKGAQRIVLELKDRVGPVATTIAAPGRAPSPAVWRDQVRAGLLGLGWSVREADAAVESVADIAADAESAGRTPDVAALLRAALQSLSRS